MPMRLEEAHNIMRKRVKGIVTVIFACFFLALSFNITVLPLEIVIGGSSGLSIIANHFLELLLQLLFLFVIYLLLFLVYYS